MCKIKVEQGAMFGDPYPVGYEMLIYINGKKVGSTIREVDIGLYQKIYNTGFKDGERVGFDKGLGSIPF
jgi:hypothetical protein